MTADMETTDVIICGCGPTGAMLSGYLGQQSVKNIVLEKELDITEDPRGIVLDEDGIRLLQGVGVYNRIFTEIGQKMGYFNFISGANDLHAAPFLRFNYNTIEGGTGHPGFICHKQPVLERALRDVIEEQPESAIRSGSAVQMITEDENYVYVTYTNAEGEEKKLRSKFFVGADGKTGFTRKKYLEPKGITMERDEKFKYEAAWVALNWKITPPTPETHPDFPLWKLGYTSDQVYDLFFPAGFTFICNPDRPSICGRFGLRDDHLLRFEYVVKPEEDGNEMAEYDNVKKVVYPYLTHAKERYNLSEDVAFPGDSAHVFPPFGGQGIASGFRDAASLAWRLKIACRPNFHGHEKFFEAWYMERKQQLEKSLAATIVNGNFCNEPSPLKTFFRDRCLWGMQKIPSWRHWLELGQRQEGLMTYAWALGMPFIPKRGGGKTFPQLFCTPYHTAATRPVFTDDLVFGKGKTALFQLVVLLANEGEMPRAMQDLAALEEAHEGELKVDEATYLVEDKTTEVSANLSQSLLLKAVHRIMHKDKEDASIWSGLPEPTGYHGSRMRKEVRGKYVIVRPDRFIFAVCNSARDLIDISRSLSKALSGL